MVHILHDISGAEDYILRIPDSSKSTVLYRLLEMIVKISVRNQIDYSGQLIEIIERHISKLDLLKVFLFIY